MISMPTTVELPLLQDEYGSIRIGGTRVTLDLVVLAFRDGATVEQIAEEFDTLDVADVHVVIGYYLKHREEVDQYLARREVEAREWQERFSAEYPPRVTHDELMTRWAARQEK
jgi:uncharacterized protein (DUF433 family)